MVGGAEKGKEKTKRSNKKISSEKDDSLSQSDMETHIETKEKIVRGGEKR